MPSVIYPFTAIVGQERLKRALVLNAVNPLIGGVLIRGERGTAKSTAARALAALLPDIRVVADCRFSCDPDRPETWCDECRERAAKGKPLPVGARRTRLVDLPVSATEDRVVGTLDIEKAIQKGERHFGPGVLANANRGILYVDEVSLLDDHVVDLLLDSAAMGVNVVEREGISFQHPAQFVLVGTMNPEEGELRPQLLDRFGLAVEIKGIPDAEARVEIIERRLAFEQDPEGFCSEWCTAEEKLSTEIDAARQALPSITHIPADLYAIAELSAGLEVDGHRADLVILKSARAHCALMQRRAVTEEDILLAAELALPHRLKRKAFQDVELRMEQLERRLDQSKQGIASQGQPKSEQSRAVKKKASLAADQTSDTTPQPSD